MLTVKRLFFAIHILFALIIGFAWGIVMVMGFDTASLPFMLFISIATLLVLVLVIFDIFLAYHNDLLTPFVDRDLGALYKALENRIFNRMQFSSTLISYYLLLCLKLGYSWRLRELEALVKEKKPTRYGALVHFFSLHYLANGNLEECRTWYTQVFAHKNIKEKNDVHFDYAFKLISLGEVNAALEQMQWLLNEKLSPFLALLTVYLTLIMLEKLPSDSPYISAASQSLMRQQSFVSQKKSYLKKLVSNSNNYKVDIHFILLENIAKEAIGWLESWTARK